MLNPLGRNVLVRMKARKSESEGGIAIPERSQSVEVWGDVRAVGGDCEQVKVGDVIYVTATQGTHYVDEGEDLIVIDERQVYCVKEE